MPAVQVGKGLVYLYRESSFKGAGIQYDIKDNGDVIGALQSGTYFYEYATPGPHTYSAKTEASTEVTINVEAGDLLRQRLNQHGSIRRTSAS